MVAPCTCMGSAGIFTCPSGTFMPAGNSFTGTSVTVKIQESSDNGAGDAWADVTGGGFTAATGVTTQRLETARGQTVERYLRAVTTGTFSSATFAVVAVRNDTSTVF